MQIGDLLVAAKLVTADQIVSALARQMEHGGLLGENLIAIGAITQEELDRFLHMAPAEPASIADTGISENDLLGLLMKLAYTRRLETVEQFVEAIKLPRHVVTELVAAAIERRLLRVTGTRDGSLIADMNYTFCPSSEHLAQLSA